MALLHFETNHTTQIIFFVSHVCPKRHWNYMYVLGYYVVNYFLVFVTCLQVYNHFKGCLNVHYETLTRIKLTYYLVQPDKDYKMFVFVANTSRLRLLIQPFCTLNDKIYFGFKTVLTLYSLVMRSFYFTKIVNHTIACNNMFK